MIKRIVLFSVFVFFFGCGKHAVDERVFSEIRWFGINRTDEIIATDSVIYLVGDHVISISSDNLKIRNFFEKPSELSPSMDLDNFYEGAQLSKSTDAAVPNYLDLGPFKLAKFNLDGDAYKIYYLDDQSYFLIDWIGIKYISDDNPNEFKFNAPFNSEVRKIKVIDDLVMIFFSNNSIYYFDKTQLNYSVIFEGDTTDRYDKFLDIDIKNEDTIIFSERGFLYRKNKKENYWLKSKLNIDWGEFLSIVPPPDSFEKEHLPDYFYFGSNYLVKGLIQHSNIRIWIIWDLKLSNSLIISENKMAEKPEFNKQMASDYALSEYTFLADTLLVIRGHDNASNTEVYYLGFLK